MAAVAGLSTQFRRWSGSAWVLVAEITSINGAPLTRTAIETTTMDNTDYYKTFIPGMVDPGEIALEMNFDRTVYDVMKTDMDANVLKNYEIVLPDASSTSLEFEGFVTAMPIKSEADTVVTSSVTIKISGKPTINSGSGS